jgi:hypothetical protein
MPQITAHMGSLIRIPEVAHKGLQGAPIILVHPLHYTKIMSLLFMFSCFSDSEHNHNEYENAHIRRILRNSAMANKLGIKGLSSILDAMKPTCSPPTDSCLEYDPNYYSELKESKADGLSCSPIKVPILIWQGFIGCTYLA